MLTIRLPDEQSTLDLGKKLAQLISPTCVIYLQGDLGAGKTTLVRGFLRGLGVTGPIKSPTYTLVESYEVNDWDVFHFDLYRIADPAELEFIGLAEYFNQKSICFIEWPEHGTGVLPRADIACKLVSFTRGRWAKLSNSPKL